MTQMAKKKETKGESQKTAEKNEAKTQNATTLGTEIDELQAKIDSLKGELTEEKRKNDGILNDNEILHTCIEKLTEENERQADQIERLSEIPLIQRLFCYNRTVKRITGKK